MSAKMDATLPIMMTPLASQHPLDGLHIYTMKPLDPSKLEKDCIYSDGSCGDGKCASAACLSDGTTLALRPPGYASSYKAEVYALCLAVCMEPLRGKIVRVDSQGVLDAVLGGNPRVIMGNVIETIRQQVMEKGLILSKVRATPGSKAMNKWMWPPKKEMPCQTTHQSSP